MPIYIRPEDMAAAGASADVICIGDSWFWHPFGNLQHGGFRREVVATLVDTFGHWQSELANQYANTTFVRTSGTIADNQWLDELRPSPAGFKKIAKKFAA
ncbi:MAG: hypothetical protein ING75_14095 [Rhodocyclaceae bacterium]|nr:hypothetical protein [Rhodocyclaceae bacterium]